MKIIILTVGKKHDLNLENIISDFEKRIKISFDLSWKILNSVDDHNKDIQKKKETEKICDFLRKERNNSKNIKVVLLDERGDLKTTKNLASFLEENINSNTNKIIFIIGGAFGVDQNLFKENKIKIDYIISISKMTFPHQLVRLILIEQIYRSISILKNEKYHHE